MDPISEAALAERLRWLENHTFTWERQQRSPAAALDLVREDMAEALAARLGAPEPKAEGPRRFLGQPLLELVRPLLALRGATPERMDALALISRAISTGDLPVLLTGAGNRVLAERYKSAGGILDVARRVTVKDLRDRKVIQVDAGDATLLPEVPDGGYYTQGTLTASAESYQMLTFGRIFTLTNRLLADDDLGAYQDLLAKLGTMAAEVTAKKVAALLEANPNMSDGVAVFHGTHKNLGSAGALSETTLAEALKLLRAQTAAGGQSVSVAPRTLLVPPALEFLGRKTVAALGIPAPIQVAVEPRLASATAFYVFADPGTVAALEVASLAGAEGPQVEVGLLRGYEAVAVRLTLDVGYGFVDFRGCAKNAGA